MLQIGLLTHRARLQYATFRQQKSLMPYVLFHRSGRVLALLQYETCA